MWTFDRLGYALHLPSRTWGLGPDVAREAVPCPPGLDLFDRAADWDEAPRTALRPVPSGDGRRAIPKVGLTFIAVCFRPPTTPACPGGASPTTVPVALTITVVQPAPSSAKVHSRDEGRGVRGHSGQADDTQDEQGRAPLGAVARAPSRLRA